MNLIFYELVYARNRNKCVNVRIFQLLCISSHTQPFLTNTHIHTHTLTHSLTHSHTHTHTHTHTTQVVKPEGFTFKDSNGREFHIPCGEFVGASHIVPHLIDFKDEPEAYKPDRFLDKSKEDLLTVFRFVFYVFVDLFISLFAVIAS